MVRLNPAARALIESGPLAHLVTVNSDYIGPGTNFPPMRNPPPGTIAHIRIVKITGAGDWAEASD